MSDLTERVARMVAEYVEHASADQMVKGEGGDLVPFWTRQVPFARDVIREVLAALREWDDPELVDAFAREHGLGP